MEFSITYYNYANVAVMAVLATLIALLSLQHTRPDKALASYRKARGCLIGMYVLIMLDLLLSLVANNVHLSDNADTAIDVLCYTPIAILFTWMITWLFDDGAGQRSYVWRDVAIWLATLCGSVAAIVIQDPTVARVVLIAVAGSWILFIVHFAVRVLRIFRKAMASLSNFYSDHMEGRITWLRNGFLSFVFFGVMGPVAALCPPWINIFYMLCGGAVYIYMCSSLLNYYGNYEAVSKAVRAEASAGAGGYGRAAREALQKWSDGNGYRKVGVSLEDMAQELGVSCSAISHAIGDIAQCSFREYVNRLRVRDAKVLLVHNPDEPIEEIARALGYRNADEMATNFKQIANVSPQEWRDGVMRLM